MRQWNSGNKKRKLGYQVWSKESCVQNKEGDIRIPSLNKLVYRESKMTRQISNSSRDLVVSIVLGIIRVK